MKIRLADLLTLAGAAALIILGAWWLKALGVAALGAPVAGALPRRPGFARSQAVRRLRDALYPASGRPPKVMLVVDALPGPAEAMDVATSPINMYSAMPLSQVSPSLK